MAKLAVLLIIFGTYLSQAAFRDLINQLIPDAQIRITFGVIILIIGLIMLNRKINIFNFRL